MIPVNKASAIEESEVEALLAFDRALAAGDDLPASVGSDSFLQPVHECQRLLEAVWPRSAASSFELPKQFGRFSIVRELGRGGFGVVFLAEDPVLGRQVALKVPRPEVLVTPEVRRRFLREAEAASRLDHPHIVPVYEVGEEGPICYIASAYCEGPTLAQWLRLQTGSVPVRLATRLVAVLSAAVAHAHERGILHRDLKPSNILLQRSDGSPSARDEVCHELGFVPRICDFGLAKLLDQVSQETRSGVPIGSPEYMAPEQAAGRLREQGPATDVYALGVILYELLTGRPPHRGETDLETLRLVTDQDPPSPRALRPGLPRDLETIALKCLEKRPARRYSSASELAADLQRFLDGKPVGARPVPAWQHAGKWARRRPVHATLAVVLGAFVLAIVGGLEWARAREKRHDDALRASEDRSRKVAADQLKYAGLLAEREEFERAMSVLETLKPSQGLPDSRGFVWHYLQRLARPHVTMLPPLPARARAVAYARDGRTIALADEANNTFLMNRDSGTLRELPAKHKLPICHRLVFSPDGRALASLSHGANADDWAKSEVKLWDVAGGALLEGLPENFGYCYQILFSPDGETLVTVDAVLSNPEPPVRSWRISTDRKRVTLAESLRGDQLKTHLSPTARVADTARGPFRLSDVLSVTPEDNSTTAVSLETGETWLYTTGAGYCRAVCRVQGAEVVFIPRTDLAVPYTKDEVDEIGQIASAVTGRARARPIRQGATVLWARFSRDGRTAAVQEPYPGHRDGRLRLIDVGTGRVGVESPWGELWSGCVCEFAPEGDALVVAGLDAQARVWDFNHWRGPGVMNGHKKEVWGLAFSPDGRTLASSSDDHTLKLWDVATGLEKMTLKGHGSLVAAVAFSPDGKLLASTGWDKTIRLWNANTGVLLATLSGHSEEVRTLAFSPDGTILASAGNERTIRLWDVAVGRQLEPPLTGHTDGVYSVAFTPDGKTLYSGGDDQIIRLWGWEKGQLRASWPTDDDVRALAFTPNGQTLAVGHFRGAIRLWDVTQQKAGSLLRGHVGDVFGVAFSPDGRTLASAGRDHTVRLWDPVIGDELLTLKGHEAEVHGIKFSPDGTILATGSHDGAIKLWRTSPGLADRSTRGTAPSRVSSH